VVSEAKADSNDAIATILERMETFGHTPAVFSDGRESSYREYMDLIWYWVERLSRANIETGTVVAIRGEFTPMSMSLLWALAKHKAIAVPLTTSVVHQEAEFLAIAGAEVMIDLDRGVTAKLDRLQPGHTNELIQTFREQCKPGLVVFTSGSTGQPKGILHDMERVARKFVAPRPNWRTVMFLMFDHFGGINTFLSTAAYGGVAVCLSGRGPSDVCRAIDQGRATLLPTTPTFLNLLLASGAHKQYDLSSVKAITYGT